MKHILITTIVAVVLVGCGSSVPDQTIHEAAHLGDIEAVKQHLAAGTDVNVLGDEDYEAPPLYWAAHGGHKEIVELLIAEGANVNAKDENSLTPLDWAIYEDHPEIADLLRKHGAKESN
jgi:hypothetical protein